MATLVLTVVGTVLGGPIGGAIGALAGRAVDQAVLFKPKGRDGPRLNDLHLQTSVYGSQVPQLFGTMRVAGTVIWATDLRETRHKSGGGKGRPSVTSYSYTASFAVALSARTVRSIGRIWADGNLLRGSGGDWKNELAAFRLHKGDEGQAVDPLIAAAQGAGFTPAHRGMAYVVFEDLALADYGNRIPSLTFEVEADAGSVDIGAVAGVLTDGGVTGGGLTSVQGFAAGGETVREALTPLVDGFGLMLRVDEGSMSLRGPEVDMVQDVPRTSLCQRIAGQVREPVAHSVSAAEAVPRQLSLRHYDVERDYQAGVQKATRPGPGRMESGLELPVVMAAGEARTLAANRLGAAWIGRSMLTVTCGWDALACDPASIVRVEGEPGLWRIDAREWEGMAVQLFLRRVSGVGAGSGLPASSGMIVRQVDAPHGPTTLRLIDLPPLTQNPVSAPVVVAVASGGEGWRRAALLALSDTGEASPIGQTAPRAVMGRVLNPPGVGSALLLDGIHRADVELLAGDMLLTGADEAALARGENLCVMGGELMQFAAATQIGPATFRLTGLRRGLRGTEWAMTSHEAGEDFLLLDEDRLFEVPPALLHRGETLNMAAIGVGDDEPAGATVTVTGEALMPPCPVHVTADPDGAGGWNIGWTRQSRLGWQWRDGVDAPLGEEREAYAVRVLEGGVPRRSVECDGPNWTYGAAMAAVDRTGAGPLTIEIRQIGSQAVGRAATVTIMA